jgi:virginiamycin B lyase
VEISGVSDGKMVRGNRIGRITPRGEISEFDIPTPDCFPANIAVGPDRQIWFTERNGNKLGRVSRDGKITEIVIPTPRSQPVGLTAGADRQPPGELVDRLWFAEQGSNQIGFLDFGGH